MRVRLRRQKAVCNREVPAAKLGLPPASTLYLLGSARSVPGTKDYQAELVDYRVKAPVAD